MKNKQAAPISSSKLLDKGLVEVFTGGGKGKTSAALGIVLRALGYNLRVHIIYFMKSSYPYGEREILSRFPNLSLSSFGQDCFCDPDNVKPEDKEQAKMGLVKAREVTCNGKYDVVVLDEINVAIAWKLLEIDEVIELINNKPKNVELILTGRYADAKLINAADLVTEMVSVKHPYDKGVPAREGIDY